MSKNEKIKSILPPFRTYSSVNVPHNKHTMHLETIAMPSPETVTIPLLEHIGAVCEPCVKIGDRVTVGEKIGDSSAFFSAPIHSSVSGTVKKFTTVTYPKGERIQSIIIESDGLDEMCRSITKPAVKTQSELINAVRESGLVGLGGAGFPTHIKLDTKGKAIDTLLINSAECEPFITADYREMIEFPDEIISGILKIKQILNMKTALICIERNKPSAIKLLAEKLAALPQSENIKIVRLKSSYPQGAEKVLVQAATGRVIASGSLPSDVGCLVMNVTSVSFIAKYLKDGKPLTHKRITVDGDCVNKRLNVSAPIGTSVNDIIEFCGGLHTPARKILMGGPMMGIALYDTSFPILKYTNALLSFSENASELDSPSACIRCGMCISKCPMRLLPTSIEKASAIKDTAALKKFKINTCIECGSCSYICPANRHILQSIRIGKQQLREAEHNGQ